MPMKASANMIAPAMTSKIGRQDPKRALRGPARRGFGGWRRASSISGSTGHAASPGFGAARLWSPGSTLTTACRAAIQAGVAS